jgi:serine/threonine-protein kinase HipA
VACGAFKRLLDNLRNRAVQEANTLYAEVEAENTQIAQARPYLSATMAGESRCLRVILHTILKEMARQLA